MAFAAISVPPGDEALRRVERFGNVWQATPGDVAKHYRETMMG